MANSGFASINTAWGVTPHAQNTGTSPVRTVTASPQSARVRSEIPIPPGSPQSTGAPAAREQPAGGASFGVPSHPGLGRASDYAGRNAENQTRDLPER